MRSLVVGSLVAAFLILAAGCGGSTPSASEQWAGSVCSTMDTWATQMQGYADDVKSAVTSPSTDSVNTIKDTIAKGSDATNQMLASLRSLGPPPPGSNGQSASSALESFKTQVQQTVTSVEAQAQSLQSSSDPATIVSTLGTIATDVSTVVSQGKTTFQTLQSQQGELKDAFNNVDSCKQLQNDFG
jgi:hypothetical protein